MAEPRQLPIVKICRIDYYRDDRLKQYRQVDNPHNFISFEEAPLFAISATALEIKTALNWALSPAYMPRQMIQHFKEVESRARQAIKELEALEGGSSETPLDQWKKQAGLR